jgi:predicted transcriptional regulator
MTDDNPLDNVSLAAELTVAWLSNSNTRVAADEVPAFLKSMHQTISGLSEPAVPEAPAEEQPQTYEPAVSVRKSLASPDHIISMIDGKPYRTLKRHLATKGLTPAEYRARYKLKADYPMVAASYSEARRSMAHKIGLGRKAAPVEAPEAVKATRKPRAAKAPVEAPTEE